MLLVHAGNRIDGPDRADPRFPPNQVGAVTAVVARAIASLEPAAVVSAPANGADLIVLTEAQRLGVAAHVLLPLPAAEFVRRSVATADGWWIDAFHSVLMAAETPGSSVTELDLTADRKWYLTANGALLRLAAERAGPTDHVVALTVRPVEGSTPPSASDDFAGRAAAAGLTVLTIDPRPGRTGAITLV